MESSRRDSAPRVSLTNPELLRFPPRKRKVNFGKPEEWILKKNKPGNGCKKHFHVSISRKKQKKKTNANLFSLKLQENSYWFCLSSSCLYNKQSTTPPKIILYTTLIVFFHYTQQFFCYFFKVFLYLSNSPIK